MKSCYLKILLGAASSMVLSHAALAQEADDQDAEISAIEEVIVTGRAGGAPVTQFESSVSITTFNEEKIREAGALTLSDLFAEVPGVWAETSGGEAASNVFVRGIPAPGQFLFSKIHVDGLPVFEEHGIGFLTPDGMLRVDETISRVEAVRGGSSSIFASNAPGGIFNHITRRGTDTPEGILKGEYGNFNRFRVDGFYGGPIAEDTFVSIGGFYRVADGVRDPGFRGDEGGQLRASLTRLFDGGDITVTGGYVNERNIFYLPIPLDLDDSGDLTSVIGLDANFDTLVSDDSRVLNFIMPAGELEQFDLTDGIHNENFNVGIELNLEFNEWVISNKSRFVSGFVQFNTQIALDVEDGAVFLEGRLAELQGRIASGEFTGTSDEAFNDTTSLAVEFVNGSPFAFNPPGTDAGGNNGNGLIGTSIFFATRSEFENFQNDLQVGREFDLFGKHNLTIGFYASVYSIDQTQLFSSNVHEIDGSPENLEILALNDAGETVGTVTQGSFDNFGGGAFENYLGDGDVFAIYLSDEWAITDKLRLDLGFRYEAIEIDGAVETPGSFNLSDDNPLLADGALPTLADNDIISGIGIFNPFQQTYGEFSYSFGVNYEITESIAFYSRVSDGARTPTMDDLAVGTLTALGLLADGTITGTVDEFLSDNILVNDIFQVEGGFKISLPYIEAFVTGFFSSFDDSTFSETVELTPGEFANITLVQSSSTLGIEAEAQVGPFYGFSLNAKGTFQRPEFNDFAFLTPLPPGVDPGSIGPGDVAGNDVNRIAGRIINIRPKYEFYVDYLEGFAGSVFVDIMNVDDRFSDPANTIILPGFTTLGAGFTLNYGSNLELTIIADNLTNTIGLTEGNPRTDTLAGPAAAADIATFARPIVGRNLRLSLAYRF
ncbi:MAG: TonB-dependent receptor [Pseudomonadota bacterium]